MAITDFSLPISELNKMHEDGDIISLFFSYVCIICIVFFCILMPVYYYLWPYTIIKIPLYFIFLPLSAISWGIVLIYRPIFLTDDRRKQNGLRRVERKKFKALDKLKGMAYEEALQKMSNDERDRYLDDLDYLTYKKKLIIHLTNHYKRVILWIRKERKESNP